MDRLSRKKQFCLRGHDTFATGRYFSACVACSKLPERKAQRKDYKLQRDFGISLEEYNRIFNEQNGLCSGCYRHQSSFKLSLSVDHCHLTGEIRGLLCTPCNQSIGLCQDNPEILERLATYLRNARSRSKS